VIFDRRFTAPLGPGVALGIIAAVVERCGTGARAAGRPAQSAGRASSALVRL
jgi:hypothetical protein